LVTSPNAFTASSPISRSSHSNVAPAGLTIPTIEPSFKRADFSKKIAVLPGFCGDKNTDVVAVAAIFRK
jgi:hypothetical protein